MDLRLAQLPPPPPPLTAMVFARLFCSCRPFYLSSQHLQQLKAEYGIEPWHFEQHCQEGVFIPAGCPHQVPPPPPPQPALSHTLQPQSAFMHYPCLALLSAFIQNVMLACHACVTSQKASWHVLAGVSHVANKTCCCKQYMSGSCLSLCCVTPDPAVVTLSTGLHTS